MISFIAFITEAITGKHFTISFGRLNPITSGHALLAKHIKDIADANGGAHSFVLSHSVDNDKNPLTPEQKLKYAKEAFPGMNINIASKEMPTLLHHVAAAHAAGYKHLHVVVGEDRKPEFETLLNKYNGKSPAKSNSPFFNFKSITVHSAGHRDPDSDDVSGISASKMRHYAKTGDKESFVSGAPNTMSDKSKSDMYDDVRKGMHL